MGALTLTSFNSFLKNFYKLQRATPPSSRKSEPAIFEMIKMVAIKDPEYRKEFKQELAIQKPANVTALTTLVREMLRSDQVYDQLDELRSGTTTRLTNAQAAAIEKAGIDATRLGTSEAQKVAEALLAKTRADPRKTDWRPPRGNRPGGGGVEVPRDSDGNITKWVEGMRTCRCGINGGCSISAVQHADVLLIINVHVVAREDSLLGRVLGVAATVRPAKECRHREPGKGAAPWGDTIP